MRGLKGLTGKQQIPRVARGWVHFEPPRRRCDAVRPPLVSTTLTVVKTPSPSPLPRASESDPVESGRGGGGRRGAAPSPKEAQHLFHAVYCVNRSQAYKRFRASGRLGSKAGRRQAHTESQTPPKGQALAVGRSVKVTMQSYEHICHASDGRTKKSSSVR